MVLKIWTTYMIFKRSNLDQGIAQMLHDNEVLDTPATKRARRKVLVPAPTKYHEHKWLKGVWGVWPPRYSENDPNYKEEFWYYTNDGTINQYKAAIWRNHRLECFEGKVRRLPDTSVGGTLTSIQDYLEGSVEKLISDEFDFYGPTIFKGVVVDE